MKYNIKLPTFAKIALMLIVFPRELFCLPKSLLFVALVAKSCLTLLWLHGLYSPPGSSFDSHWMKGIYYLMQEIFLGMSEWENYGVNQTFIWMIKIIFLQRRIYFSFYTKPLWNSAPFLYLHPVLFLFFFFWNCRNSTVTEDKLRCLFTRPFWLSDSLKSSSDCEYIKLLWQIVASFLF